ncbi:uncharacterized protein LOC123723347 [Papilio machaon]|uniref:uncharacterized protein LOC123723347 n=1 Tax=Papilio machaon TaxID=76193 RepID=UPI001E663AF5|nr:uncharacterized protein LOC123723347 [Papilio machaon]
MVRDLKNLYNTVNESLVALKNLGMEVDAWGPILTRIITRKWDKSTNHLNELSLDNPHKRQEFAEIMKFMDKRIKSLEITSVQDNQRMTGQQNYTKIKGTPGHDKKPFNKTKTCAMCNGINHAIMNCTMFKMLDLNARIRIVDERRICHCCLSHDSRIPCQSTKNCEICNKKHHTLLHRWGVHSETTKKESNVDQKTRNKRNVRTYNSQASKSGQISALLPTAIIQIKSSSGEPQLFRALCDQGSEVSFCTEEVAQILGYPKHKISAKISGIGNSKAREASSMIIASISRRRPNGYEMQVPLIILPKLTSALPNKNINEFEIKEIREDLTDPTYNRRGKIDILLGASEYGQMLLPGLKKLENGAIAQNTQLGWIVSGNINNNIGKPIRLVSMVSRREEENRLPKFWEMEEVNLVANNLNEDDILCEEFYTKTTRRNKDGSYTVRIPFKKFTSGTEIQLGESRNRAAARLLQLEKRFKKDENLHRQYDNFMEEYLKLDHMEKVPWEKSSLGKYYIPHQPVVKEDSLTTKLRVVFDASSKTSSQQSLNDMMYKGPRLQEDLPSILLRWRKHRICFMADVEKMYRCIKISDCDQVYQRILWRFTNGRNTSNKTSIEEYQLTTVTYGTSAAPYLAVRTLQQLAKDERKKYPEASRVTMEDFYVDDCLSGEDDVTSAKKLQDQLIRMLKSGQFKLRKWSSNAEPLITELPHENQDMELLQLPHDETRKSLGVLWAPCYDHFTFKISVKENGTPTKRFILSEVSKIFDPLGWLGPIILKMKLLIQQLWIKNIGWDSPLDECYTNQWIEFQKQIKSVENINVPRWMGCMKKTKVELHGFCDASEKAYGAVVYSRVKTINGYIVTLLQAKSKVAPIKQKITLPRLELNAALLLARLLKKIRDTLRCDQIDLNMWSDSMITLGWIKGNPGKWNKFVGIRVSEIRNLTVPEKWNYVKSSENPADIISRGSEPNALQENKLWWEGPLWLKKQNIPMKRVIIDTHEEEIRSYHASTEEESNLWDRFSELQRMLRVLTYFRRVFSKNKSNKTLKVVEIQETLHKLLKIIQRREFETEYNALLKGGTVSKKGRIAALDPFIDEEGLIRVGGRLSNSTLTYNQKHPIILPYKHHVTDLLIRDAHKETLHGGNQATLCYIRNKYWILGIKRRIKTVLNKCVKCIRYKGVNTHQKMGQIPTARVTPSHPFSSSGVDYAGPIQVRTTKGRGHKSYKGYIALFVCLATKAIHLELVSDMTTSSFLAAFRRFTARRGHCYHMYSDNGTYFVKAARTLQHEVLEITQKPHLQDIITNIGTQWHFIPTHSPHFGGLWERGVRSMKHHLKRTIGEATLTFEELTTLLCQIESCLNSRPLCKMDESIESMQALTPSHFLIGREAVGIPDPIEQCIIREPTLRWKMIQKIKKEFWKSWTSDYLNQLQQKYKWRSQGPNVKPGDIVLIKDESISPSKWPLAKVVESHPGSDKLTRVITVQRSNGTKSKRSIHSIVPLEINENTDAAGSKEREQAQCNATYNKRKDRTYNKTNNPLKWLMLASTIMCLLTSVSGNYTLKKLDEGYYIEELGDVRVDRGVFRIDMTYAKEDLNHDWQHVVNIMKEFEDFCNETKKKTTSETQCFKLLYINT